jgi:hypothetical protein
MRHLRPRPSESGSPDTAPVSSMRYTDLACHEWQVTRQNYLGTKVGDVAA